MCKLKGHLLWLILSDFSMTLYDVVGHVELAVDAGICSSPMECLAIGRLRLVILRKLILRQESMIGFTGLIILVYYRRSDSIRERKGMTETCHSESHDLQVSTVISFYTHKDSICQSWRHPQEF